MHLKPLRETIYVDLYLSLHLNLYLILICIWSSYFNLHQWQFLHPEFLLYIALETTEETILERLHWLSLWNSIWLFNFPSFCPTLTINNVQLLSLQNPTWLLKLGPLAIIELVGRWCCLKAGVIEFSGFMASCWLSSDCLYQIFYDLMLARFNLKTDSIKN